MSLYGTLRQWRFPSEFRIHPMPWPQKLENAEERLDQAIPAASKTKTAQKDKGEPLFPPALLADVGTGIWRLRQRMIDSRTDEPLEEMRRPFRHLQWLWDKLTDAGVQIMDHTGERVPESGIYALKVIAYEAMPALEHNRVIETIKPTIFTNQERIQMG